MLRLAICLGFAAVVTLDASDIPAAYHGEWYSLEHGLDSYMSIDTKTWGDLHYLDIKAHVRPDCSTGGGHATMLMETAGIAAQHCFYCVDVLYRTTNVIQVKKGACLTTNTGFENMCPGYTSLPTADTVTTYFRQNVLAENCATTFGSMPYQFTYALTWNSGGVCDSPDSKVEDLYSSAVAMTFARCPGVQASYSHKIRYACLGSWSAVVGDTRYKFAAIADMDEKDRREKYKCLMTAQHQAPGEERWVMSRFASCARLDYQNGGSVTLVLRPRCQDE